MSITHISWQATISEIVVEMDRRGEVIITLEAKVAQLERERDAWKRTSNSPNTLQDAIDKAHNAALAVKEERAIAQAAEAKVAQLERELAEASIADAVAAEREACARLADLYVSELTDRRDDKLAEGPPNVKAAFLFAKQAQLAEEIAKAIRADTKDGRELAT